MPADRPLCLTVAGSDSSGGAGLQTDLAVFRVLGCHGASAVTCVTAQSHDELRSVTPMDAACVREQLACVLEQMPVAAVKTGALANVSVVRVLAEELARFPNLPLVVDPVLSSTTGKPLITADAEEVLVEMLLPRAALLTPNLPEAATLSGDSSVVASPEDYAEALWSRFGVPVLVKGGHEAFLATPLTSREPAPCSEPVRDWFCDGALRCFESPRLRVGNVRGTGCALASAITAYLAQGEALPAAIEKGHRALHHWMSNAVACGAHQLLRIGPV